MANDFPSLPSRKHAKTEEEEKEEKKEEKNPQNSSAKEKAEKFRISYVHQSPPFLLSSCVPPPSHANNSEGIKMREENRCMSSRFGD